MCAADELGVERDTEMSVEDDAKERAAAGLTATVGEERVVGEDGTDAGEDGVAGVAKTLDFGSRFGPRQPVGLVGEA